MSSPVRLQKTEEKSAMGQIDMFFMKYAHILLPIFIILLLFFMIALAVAIADISSTHSVSMTDSGNYYNHLKDVVT